VPLATFKDLCLDAADPVRLGAFWAAALGLELEDADDGDTVLRGATPAQTVWVNRVPEPRTVKNRLHLDVFTESIDALRALGATVLAEFPRWTVLADPEGGEFCGFVRDAPPAYRLYEIGWDTAEPRPVARWWAELLGARYGEEGDDFSFVEDIPGAEFGSLDMDRVPEPKTAKNRVHLDLVGDRDAVLAAGATVLTPRGDRSWDVLADPWGNEFCLLPTAADG
jgi:hypothetical protein